MSPEDFSNYENLIDLFIDLRDGNINPRKVLKDQIPLVKRTFKSALGEIKKGN